MVAVPWRLTQCPGTCWEGLLSGPEPPSIRVKPTAGSIILLALSAAQLVPFIVSPSRRPDQVDAQKILKTNRAHWCIENSYHYIIDWNFDEDRSRIPTGHGPENISRLRRFAVGIIKSKGVYSVAEKMREPHRNTRLAFDYLRMSRKSPRPLLRVSIGRTNLPCVNLDWTVDKWRQMSYSLLYVPVWVVHWFSENKCRNLFTMVGGCCAPTVD
jgi:hypothetical protein